MTAMSVYGQPLGRNPCWTKALQQMRPASKATIVCPADTAYGSRPVGIIPPNSALVFEVELLDIED